MTDTGDLIAGRYRLVARIATGGMGSVWEAWDEVLQRRIALKELLPQAGLGPADAELARNRVIREARITARLHHPHAVTIFDVVDHDGRPCLIMEFVPSRTLGDLLQNNATFPPERVAAIGAQVASALAAAHQVGIVHRDVKPGNVLILADGSAKLTDFGISHAVGDVNLTSTGMLTGTPAYLAPEVARGSRSSFAADVFSLGATLYRASEGIPPFGMEDNPMAMLHLVASGRVIPPQRSGALTPMLLRMLAPTPGERPAMTEVAQVLAERPAAPAQPPPSTVRVNRTVRDWDAPAASAASAAVAGTPQHSNPQDPVPGTSRPTGTSYLAGTSRRRRTGVWVATLAAIAVAALVAGSLLLRGGTSPGGQTTGTSSSATTTATGGTGSRTSGTRVAGPADVPTGGGATTSGRITSAVSGTSTGNASTRTSGSANVPTPTPTRSPATAPGTPVLTANSTGNPGPSIGTTDTTAVTTSGAATTGATSSPPSSTKASTGKTKAGKTKTAGGTGQPTADQLAAAVTDYYALLPSNTDAGWSRLTTNFQNGTAQNRPYYQRFWDSISEVDLTNASGAAPDTARATITYHFKDGRVAVEDTSYTLVDRDGVLKINSSTVLTSSVS